MQWQRDSYTLTDDPTSIEVSSIHRLLRLSYWAADRTPEVIAASVKESLCFSLHCNNEIVGFARFVTDKATFSWFCDFIIHPEHRARGIGTWMLGVMIEHPDVRTTRILLGTRDAHELYRRFGFREKEIMRRPATG